MAQFGNRMFGGAVPGLLGGISDMMARYPALGGGMTRPAFNKLPPGMPGAIPIDLSQAQNLPAFQQGGPTNYPGVSTPAVMPPSFGGGVIGYTPPPFSGTPDFSNSQPMPMPTPGNRPGMGWGAAGPRPMPPGGFNGYHPNVPGRGNEGRIPMPLPGGPTNYPGIERPMPPMGGSVGAGMRPPGARPIGGNMMPGGVRPGTFYRPNRLPRDPRAPMRGM